MFRWKYQDNDITMGAYYWGHVALYGGGGFYQDLALNKEETVDILSTLKEQLWITRNTRAVFMDFTVYNGNLNLFCIIK